MLYVIDSYMHDESNVQLCNNISNITHTVCFEEQTLFLGNAE